jgi:hypothetical protein
MLLRHQYVSHFPVGKPGECILFYSEVAGKRIVGGVILDYSIPRGETSILIVEPKSLQLSGDVTFQNSEIRDRGYILLGCNDE